MPRRTPKGTGLVRRIFGFRTYIETAESQEARFQEKENLFSRYLPYAIVFGCTEKWARAFRGLAEQAQPMYLPWYVGHGTFSVDGFTSSISHFAHSSIGTIPTNDKVLNCTTNSLDPGKSMLFTFLVDVEQ